MRSSECGFRDAGVGGRKHPFLIAFSFHRGRKATTTASEGWVGVRVNPPDRQLIFPTVLLRIA